MRGYVIHDCLIVVASRVGGVVGYFHRPQKPLIQSRYTHISECFLLARLRRRINGLFSVQKGGNKLLSVAKISARQLSGAKCCYQMARGRRTLHQASVSVRMPRGEHRRKAFTLRHPHHRPSCYACIRTVYCMLYCFSAAISYYCICSRFCWCILY